MMLYLSSSKLAMVWIEKNSLDSTRFPLPRTAFWLWLGEAIPPGLTERNGSDVLLCWSGNIG